MRVGKAAGEPVELLSDPEIRFVLTPLTDGEYIKALRIADQVEASDSPAGLLLRDQVQREAILLFSAREMFDWTQHFFETVEEVQELGQHEVNHLFDIYLEMTATNSPTMMQMTADEVDDLKKALGMIDWNALNGQQWYAAKRFLSSIQEALLMASYSGSSSILKSTATTKTPTPVQTAEPSAIIPLSDDAEAVESNSTT